MRDRTPQPPRQTSDRLIAPAASTVQGVSLFDKVDVIYLFMSIKCCHFCIVKATYRYRYVQSGGRHLLIKKREVVLSYSCLTARFDPLDCFSVEYSLIQESYQVRHRVSTCSPSFPRNV
jgi:hypothetical protein